MKVECKELPGQLKSRVEDIEIIIIWMLLVVQYLYFSLELYYKVFIWQYVPFQLPEFKKGKMAESQFQHGSAAATITTCSPLSKTWRKSFVKLTFHQCWRIT